MKFTRIKGEDKPQNLLRLPILGKIRLGIKKVSNKSGKEYPFETDYFVCPPEVQAKFGGNPKTLPVMVPVENEDMFFRQYYACYGSNQRLKCQGDGEKAERRDEVGKKELISCPSPENCEYGKTNKCHARTDVLLVLPDINCGGVYQISTGSVNSDIDIRSGLEMAKHLFGRVSWCPMQIERAEKKIPDPTTGKMQAHWPVKLYPVATVSEANIIRQDTKRILERQERLALPEPISEGPLSDTPIEYIEDETIEGTVEPGLSTKNESVVPFKPTELEKAQELPLEQQPEATGKATEPPQAQKRKAMEKRIQEIKKIIKKGTFDQIRSEYPQKATEFSMQDLVMLAGRLEKALADQTQSIKEVY